MFNRSRSAETKSAQLKLIATDGIGSCLMTDLSYWRVKIPSPKEDKGIAQTIDLIVQFHREDFHFAPAFYYYPALDICKPVEESAAAFKYYSPGTIYSSKRSIFRPDPDGLHRTPYAITIKAQGSRNMWNNYSMHYDATFWVSYFSVQVTVPTSTNLGQVREIVMAHQRVIAATDDNQRSLAKDSLWNQLRQYNPVCQVPVPYESMDDGYGNMSADRLRNIVENHLSDFEPGIQELLVAALRSTEPYMAPTVEEGETIFRDSNSADVQPFCPSTRDNEHEGMAEVDEDVPEEVLAFAFVNDQTNTQHSNYYGDPEDSHLSITMADFAPSTNTSHVTVTPSVNLPPSEPIQLKRTAAATRTVAENKKPMPIPINRVIPSKRIRISMKNLKGSSTK